MRNFIMLLWLSASLQANAQKFKPTAKVERITIEYNGKTVKAKKLTVSSEIPIHIDTAWNHVKTPALLEFVAKGMIRFKPDKEPLPQKWEIGQTYGVKMRLFGFIPFGGTHYLYIDKIEDENHTITTKEWDKAAKVWNHHIVMRKLDDGNTYYEDTITIYGGLMTGIITSFAKVFYKHRQKRWQLVAKDNLKFGE